MFLVVQVDHIQGSTTQGNQDGLLLNLEKYINRWIFQKLKMIDS